MGARMQFYRPSSLEEALEMMGRERLKPVAGGTDFLVALRRDPAMLQDYDGILDLSTLPSLTAISSMEKGAEIGALVTHSQLVASLEIKRDFPALSKAAASVGSTLIRNRGTIGGNVCNGSPSADILGPLMVYNALVILQSKKGLREIPVSDFLKGPYTTECRADELLTALYLPCPPVGARSSFVKIGRRLAQAKARMSLSYSILIREGVVEEIQLAPGAVTPTPMRFARVEKEICGQRIAQLDGEKIGELAAKEMAQITGERWSTPYKRPAIANLFYQVIDELKEEVEKWQKPPSHL